MKKIISLFLLFFIYLTVNAQKENSEPIPLYSVSVDVHEVSNRTLEADVRGHKVLIDQPKAFGADDKAPTPPEMMAVSYGSCIISTMQFLAYQRKLAISNINVTVTGSIDFSKAMGVQTTTRAGVQELKAKISFKSTMSLAEKQKFIADVFNIGAVIDNIRNATPIKYELSE